MIITFTAILLGLAAILPILRNNKFYLLNSAIIIGAAYILETYYFKAPMFDKKTFLLFVVFQIISINITTFIAYGVDKRAAKTKSWRVPEKHLHTLEFLGGWLGAYIGQKFFHHKIAKKSYMATYKFMILLEFGTIFCILKLLKLI